VEFNSYVFVYVNLPAAYFGQVVSYTKWTVNVLVVLTDYDIKSL
jgi:hypothetical protein